MTTHVRLIIRLTGRRINDAAGKTAALCGAPEAEFTDRDILWRDACRMNAPERAEWIGCDKCRRAVAERREKAATK